MLSHVAENQMFCVHFELHIWEKKNRGSVLISPNDFRKYTRYDLRLPQTCIKEPDMNLYAYVHTHVKGKARRFI